MFPTEEKHVNVVYQRDDKIGLNHGNIIGSELRIRE